MAASGAAPSAEAPAFQLIDLRDDKLEFVCRVLAEPLTLRVVATLGRTCHRLQIPTKVVLAKLRQDRLALAPDFLWKHPPQQSTKSAVHH